MLSKILLTFAFIVGAFLIFVALKPSSYRISRQTVIQAPVEKVFPFVSNTKLVDSWNPWVKMDPEIKMSYSGPDVGVGAKSSWESPGKMGVGSATVIAMTPNQHVSTQLSYTKPFTMEQLAEFDVKGDGNTTTVVWSVSGKNNFIGKLMCSFMDPEKMIGGTFEAGLSNLKALIETK